MYFITQYYNLGNIMDHGTIYLSTQDGLFFKRGTIPGRSYNLQGMRSFISNKKEYKFVLTLE